MSHSAVLKEFLYVDVDRTRSLLAQLQGGIVDAMTSESANTLEGAASASFFGFGGSGGYAREVRYQESRSFQEMIFVGFEALADEQSLISDLGDDFREPARWQSGEVHNDLIEGQLVRIQCDVQILDGKLFGQRIERFEKMADGVLNLTPKVTPKHSTPKDRARMSGAAKSALMGGISSEQLTAMSEFVDAFVGEGISLRALPCGLQYLDAGFGGALLGRREYIQEERETLFSRYGTIASSWTCVLQVAAIPRRGQGDQEDNDMPDVIPGLAAGEGEGFSRAGVESMAVELLSKMEALGIVEGPRWPTISVTPLAVYRIVPTPTAGVGASA